VSVYVDHYFAQYGRMQMSHMIADSLEELHAMADKIGVARKWFQKHASIPHYDVCKSKRELAIKLGAISVERRDFVMKMREIRLAERQQEEEK
jgi:hypothetical protein